MSEGVVMLAYVLQLNFKGKWQTIELSDRHDKIRQALRTYRECLVAGGASKRSLGQLVRVRRTEIAVLEPE